MSFTSDVEKKVGRPTKVKRGPKRKLEKRIESKADERIDCESFQFSNYFSIPYFASWFTAARVENPERASLKLRRNAFTTKINNGVFKFFNLCPIDSLIHAFLHIHHHCKRLGEMNDNQNAFYQFILSLVNNSFEDGNRIIANFIEERGLFSDVLNSSNTSKM